jgi:predicted transcriptional regulator
MQEMSTVYLDRELAERLARLASASDRSVSDVVHDAVDEYLTRHEVDDAEWRARLVEIVGRLRAGVPAAETPGHIECEITAARLEVRASRASGSG